MLQIQIAIDAPAITKAEYLRRTGLSSSSFKRQVDEQQIIIMDKKSAQSGCMVNMVATAAVAAQQAENMLSQTN